MTTLQSLPEVLLDVVVGEVVTQLLTHGHLPPQNLLVGQSGILSAELELTISYFRSVGLRMDYALLLGMIAGVKKDL